MYKLSPSDFAYLYEECKHCYYMKIKYGIYQPSMPMPGIFSAINTRLQGNLVGKSLKYLDSNLPDGEVVTQEGWITSKPIPNTSVYLKGKYDLLVKNPDNTYTLVDLKISQPNMGKISKYKSQLSAYKYGLENPNSGIPKKITRPALLIFYPDKAIFKNNIVNLSFPHKWLEVPIDEYGFINLIEKIDKLLNLPLPKPNPKCKWCSYRQKTKSY